MDIIGITTLLPYIGKYSITMFLVQKLNLLEKVAEYQRETIIMTCNKIVISQVSIPYAGPT